MDKRNCMKLNLTPKWQWPRCTSLQQQHLDSQPCERSADAEKLNFVYKKETEYSMGLPK